MTDTLMQALPPVPETLLIGGEAMDISPLKVGELPAFARAVRPLAGQLDGDPDWLRLLAEEGESLLQALAIAARRPFAWVAALAVDEAIRLAEALFAVNADFFIQSVMPEVTQIGQRIGTRVNGAMPSPTCSGPGIATPTS